MIFSWASPSSSSTSYGRMSVAEPVLRLVRHGLVGWPGCDCAERSGRQVPARGDEQIVELAG